MKARAFVTPICVVLTLCAQLLHAQQRPYSVGTVPQFLDRDSIQHLRKLLRENEPVEARKSYFGNSYTPELADIVIYIRATGEVQHWLTQGDSVRNDLVLHGERYVYALVFAEAPLARVSSLTPIDSATLAAAPGDSTPPGTRVVFMFRNARGDSVRVTSEPPKPAPRPAGLLVVSRTSLDYQADPLITRVVNAVLAKVFPGAGSGSSSGLADSVSRMRLDSLGDDREGALYVALGRMRVQENTWSRITVEPDTGWIFPAGRTRQILTNFANTDRSPFAVGVGTFLTFNARTIKNDTLVGQRIGLNVYLLGHWYWPKRPQLPAHPFGIGPVVGMSLSSGDVFSFNNFLVGVSFDRVIGDLGVDFAVSWLESQKIRTRQLTRVPRISIGVGFPL